MRLCSRCGCEDRPQLDGARPCQCGSRSLDPLQHDPMCAQVDHAVVRYVVAVAKADVVHTPSNPEGQLPLRWRDWTLLRDGNTLFRARMLCRGCIAEMEQIERREKDLRARRAKLTRGGGEQTFARVYLSQGG